MVPTATYRLWSDARSTWCQYDIVGESHHIENILSLFPCSWNRDGEELLRDVELVPEPDNPYDEWAISVRADGRVLGYLKREDAPAWAGVIRRVTASGLAAITNSRVYLYQAPDRSNLDRHGNPQTETRARVSIRLDKPEFALPLNDPPTLPYTLVPRSSIVQVTNENEHFDTLFDYVPPSGRGLLYVTLHEDIVTTARTTMTVVEVRVDNKRIGQFTRQMSQRFVPMIQHLKARGLVTACWGDITASSVAAEVRIDAVKANEADEALLDGPAVTEPVLIAAQDDPRDYRIPDAYDSDGIEVAADNTPDVPDRLAAGQPSAPTDRLLGAVDHDPDHRRLLLRTNPSRWADHLAHVLVRRDLPHRPMGPKGCESTRDPAAPPVSQPDPERLENQNRLFRHRR